MRWLCLVLVGGVLRLGAAEGPVVINEIMYHPATERDADEYIELHNPTDTAVDLGGWYFDDGVKFTFPVRSLGPGAYLVVAADRLAFAERYPDVTAMVGDWDGVLSNGGERIRLRDAAGVVVDELRYADEGSWARRREGDLDYGYRGWVWETAADGGGASLELLNSALPNHLGQGWLASEVSGGTPGGLNSVHRTDIAPFLSEVGHQPLVPGPLDMVTVSARVTLGSAAGVASLTLHYRLDGEVPGPFVGVSMVDDGLHGDGLPGDGRYGALVLAYPEGSIVEFYVQAEDGLGQTRVWPAPVTLSGGAEAQAANCLYQVGSGSREGSLPLYRLVLTQAEREQLTRLGSTRPDALSNAQFNATFISEDGVAAQARYRVGIRHRGHGSRGLQPNNFRVNFCSDDRWEGVEALNLNAQYSYLQHLASAFCRQAGLPTAQTHAVRILLNGVDPTTSGPVHLTYGCYAANEVLDGEFVERAFPDDDAGNLYRGRASDLTNQEADFRYLGDDPDLYRPVYSKENNTGRDDWTDLMDLCEVLSLAPEEDFRRLVSRTIQVENWLTYFAVMAIVDNRETGLYTGFGDDYALYAGTLDPRFYLIPHDLDTLLGQGNIPGQVEATIFGAAQIPALARLLQSPDFAPRYYAALQQQLETTFAPQNFRTLADQCLGTYVPAAAIENLCQFLEARARVVYRRIPTELEVEGVLSAPDTVHQTLVPTLSLEGTGNVLATREVLVNGQAAAWSAWEGRWSLAEVPLVPGMNRLVVRAVDIDGGELARQERLVWLASSSVVEVGGVLAEDTIWTAAEGPYRVQGSLIVPQGRRLQVEAGTTVQFTEGATLLIQGQLTAEGAPEHPIYLGGTPGTGERWGGVQWVSSRESNRLAYCVIEGAAHGKPTLLLQDSELEVESCSWLEATDTILELHDSAVVVQGVQFPGLEDRPVIVSTGFPDFGGIVIANSHFSACRGASAVVDCQGPGGWRPGRVLEVLDNVFEGGEGLGLRLRELDAHLEGNSFTGFARPGWTSGGGTAVLADRGAGVVLARNRFVSNDTAVGVRGGATLVAEHNTVVDSTVVGFDLGSGFNGLVGPGRVLLEGTILWNNRLDIDPVPVAGVGGPLLVQRCILSHAGSYEGFEQIVADPQFFHEGVDWGLREDSPAKGRGRGGLDLGAAVPPGAAIRRLDTGVLWGAEATFAVYGPGMVAYRYRLDDGAWGAERPVGEALALVDLEDGFHVLEVEGRDSAGIWRPEAQPGGRFTWQVARQTGHVLLSEVLALNDSVDVGGGRFPDLVELYNPGDQVVELTGMSLSDNPVVPLKFVFPLGSRIEAGGYLVVFADSGTEPAGYHLGFGLSGSGEGVYLFDAPERGGGLLDEVTFGLQLPDRSLGVLSDGQWQLTWPTFGRPNQGLPLGDPHHLRINEWLASGGNEAENDFVELFNPDSLPVALGGLYLSDAPLTSPWKHLIPALSFIAPQGWVAFEADGDAYRGAGHLNFKLASEQGMLRLADAAGTEIDEIVYGPQTRGVSEGRVPDGHGSIGVLRAVSPGESNPLPEFRIDRERVGLLAFDSRWRYHEHGVDLGTAWRELAYDDGTPEWQSGDGLFSAGFANLPGPINTPIALGQPAQPTVYFRNLFKFERSPGGATLDVRHLVDDGLVLYLNGDEIYRYNMPDGPLGFHDVARFTIGAPSLFGPITLPAGVLRSGVNVLAAEVHQSGPLSTDLAFGLGLEASVTVTNPYVPEVGSRMEARWLRESEVWTAEQGPIELRGDVMIPEPFTLVIRAGAVIRAAPGATLHALGGRLYFLGTAEHPIHIAPSQDSLPWGGVRATGRNAVLVLRHVDWAGGGVEVREGAVGRVEDCYLHDYLEGARPLLVSEDCPSLDVFRSHFARFLELDLTSTPVLMEDCLLEYAHADAIDLDLAPASTMIRRTIIRHGVGENTDAIDFGTGSSGTVASCLIHDIPDKGVSVGEQSRDVRVFNNVIFQAGMGVGIKEAASAVVWQNTVTDCGYGLHVFEKDPGQGGGSAVAWDNILWGNTASVVIGDNSSLDLSYSIVDHEVPGTGGDVLRLDPQFRDPANRDYRLGAGSPAMGSGRFGGDLGAHYPVGGLPDSPVGFAAEAVRATSVLLAWAEPEHPVAEFQIERSADGQVWGEVLRLGAGETYGWDDSVEPGVAYAYRLLAVGRWGLGAISESVVVLTPTDADGDSIPDRWELDHGLDPGSPLDAAEDPDGDGYSNLMEFVAGTGPWDSGDYLRLSVGSYPDGQLALAFPAQPGREYWIDYRPDLTSASWQIGVVKLSSVEAGWIELEASTWATRSGYYRLRVEPTPSSP